MDSVALGLLIGSALAATIGSFWRRTPHIPSLAEKHLFITGGSTGIGYSIVKSALSQGAYVTMTGRSFSNLQGAYDSLMKEAVEHGMKEKKKWF
ncbi:hypothetical protein R1sor_019758 [Riccia sorocarpa]|uniref:Uncharacterized protein n=1 Tax=Riccia sorocarpa TaxID=122646 RepID=A0ABD3IE32_9MARC